MSRKLGRKERCPIHRRLDCCGRAPAPAFRALEHKGQTRRGGVITFADGRERCTPAEKRRRKNKMLAARPICDACGERFTEYDEADLGHNKSKGLNGSKVDDSWGNIFLIHRAGNSAQGSRSLEAYLAECQARGVKPCQQP